MVCQYRIEGMRGRGSNDYVMQATKDFSPPHPPTHPPIHSCSTPPPPYTAFVPNPSLATGEGGDGSKPRGFLNPNSLISCWGPLPRLSRPSRPSRGCQGCPTTARIGTSSTFTRYHPPTACVCSKRFLLTHQFDACFGKNCTFV